jgi:hypothetical protein
MVERLNGSGCAMRPLLERPQGNGRRSGVRAAGYEPSLEDLLNDPIMLLLWRSEGMEPAAARAAVRQLLSMVQRSERAQSGLIRTKQTRRGDKSSLAA